MEKSHAVEDRLHRIPFCFEVAIREFLAGVVMAEIAVEADARQPEGQLNGPPGILRDRRAVRFDIDRKVQPIGRFDHRAGQGIRLRIVLEPAADMHRRRFVAGVFPFFGVLQRLSRRIDAPVGCRAEPSLPCQRRLAALNALEPRFPQSGHHWCTLQSGPHRVAAQINQRAQIQINLQPRRIGRTVIECARHRVFLELVEGKLIR